MPLSLFFSLNIIDFLRVLLEIRYSDSRLISAAIQAKGTNPTSRSFLS